VLQIVTPAPDAHTGSRVDVEMTLANAHIVPPSVVGGKLEGDQGHIHVLVDGILVSMPLRLDYVVVGLSAGPHTVEAEFVASDHLPFANRVVSAVTFTVG